MKFEMEFEGLQELQKGIDALANSRELGEINKRIVEECSKITKNKASSNIHRSKDHRRSGRAGIRTPGHAADNVPVSKVKKISNVDYECNVGWEKADNSEYFYMKFEEWGVSGGEAHAPFLKTVQSLNKEYSKIAEKEYQKFLDKNIGK